MLSKYSIKMEQRQRWFDHTRVLITTTDDRGSIQLNLYDTEQEFGGTAAIYALWVDPQFRRNGYAKTLLKRAEEIALISGHTSVYMEWELRETPREVLDWYFSWGYDVREVYKVGEHVLLEKKLK